MKSQTSVKETTKMVELALNNIRKGVELVDKTYEQLEEIKLDSYELSKISGESSESSQEQARGVNQISLGIASVEEIVQNNSASAEQNAASSKELATQAQKLADLISYFTTKRDAQIDESNEEQIKELMSNELAVKEVF